MSELTPLRLGFCAMCGKRVFTDQEYLKAKEGYCHKDCIKNRRPKAIEA